MLNKGYVLGNRYKIVSVVGKGGTSVVYRALDTRANDAQRAVKEVMKTNGTDAYNARQESLLIKEFYEKDVKNSFFPNIIEIIDNDPDALYIVQDYIDGVSMEKLLEYDPIKPKTLIRYAKDICSVMSFIHKCGFIHSDMKPDNIMVVRNNEDFENARHPERFGKLKFIDFGSVIERREGTFAYTPAYAAPEQFRKEELDEKTDIFNIGATFYHMLTGKKPMNVSLNGKLVSSAERFVFDKNMNAAVVRIIRRCVSDDKAKRYRSCDEIYAELDRAENHTYVKASAILAGIAAISLAFSAFSGVMARKNRSDDFNKLVEKAKNANTYELKVSAWEDVIHADGSYSDAYLELIALYKTDEVFDADEEGQILRLINENTNELKKDPRYEEVAFGLGILYWYYYFYGSDPESGSSTTSKKSAVKWFGEAQTPAFKRRAANDCEVARVYCTIGDFYFLSGNKENELLNKNDPAELWESMNELSELMENSEASSEMLILETYKTIVSLEFTNMSDFAKADIPFSEQKRLIEDIKTRAEAISVKSGSAAADAKEYILKTYDDVIESIEGSQ